MFHYSYNSVTVPQKMSPILLFTLLCLIVNVSCQFDCKSPNVSFKGLDYVFKSDSVVSMNMEDDSIVCIQCNGTIDNYEIMAGGMNEQFVTLLMKDECKLIIGYVKMEQRRKMAPASCHSKGKLVVEDTMINKEIFDYATRKGYTICTDCKDEVGGMQLVVETVAEDVFTDRNAMHCTYKVFKNGANLLFVSRQLVNVLLFIFMKTFWNL